MRRQRNINAPTPKFEVGDTVFHDDCGSYIVTALEYSGFQWWYMSNDDPSGWPENLLRLVKRKISIKDRLKELSDA